MIFIGFKKGKLVDISGNFLATKAETLMTLRLLSVMSRMEHQSMKNQGLMPGTLVFSADSDVVNKEQKGTQRFASALRMMPMNRTPNFG